MGKQKQYFTLFALTMFGIAPPPSAAANGLSYRTTASSVVIPAGGGSPASVRPTLRLPVSPGSLSLSPSADSARLFGGEGIRMGRNGTALYLAGGIAVLSGDLQAQKWFRPIAEGEEPSEFVKAANYLGDPKNMLPVAGVLYLAGGARERHTVKDWGNALINAGIIVHAAKLVTGKQRPDVSPDAVVYYGPSNLWNDSFPSGHTAFATATAVVFGHQYPKLKVPLGLVAAGVGYARVKGRNHWPSDVYWGAGFGYLAARKATNRHDTVISWQF